MGMRWTLYGYEVVNDTYRIVPVEASNVRKMFKEYVSGSTLKVIADGLTAKGVVYYEDKRTWNKNMVSRILENENYLGNEKYPAIIDKNVFDAAMAKRNILGGKREADSDEIKFYKTHTFCAQCGKPYRRVSKFGTREKWFCSNDCKYIHYIDDKWLFGAVVNAINTLIRNNDLIVFDSKSSDVEFDVQAIRKMNEVKHMISQNGIQFAPVKQTLFDCVSAKFDCCGLDKGSSFSEPLKEYLLEYEELQGFDTEVFPLIIEKIIVNRDSSINIELVNGQIVNSNGKEC